jgi:hypothetical protein
MARNSASSAPNSTEGTDSQSPVQGLPVQGDDPASAEQFVSAAEKPAWMVSRQQQIQRDKEILRGADNSDDSRQITVDETTKIPAAMNPARLHKKNAARSSNVTGMPTAPVIDIDPDTIKVNNRTILARAARYTSIAAFFIWLFYELTSITSLGISFLIHAVFLSSLALITINAGASHIGSLTFLQGDEGEDMGVERMDTSIQMQQVNPNDSLTSALSLPMAAQSEMADVPMIAQTETKIDGTLFDKPTDEAPNPFRGEFAPPPGTKVVTKGSFSAYTDPKDPIPQQDYYIIILIKVPPNVKQYRTSDLSGLVVGTDGYEQPIVDEFFLKTNRMLEIKEGLCRLVVKVPGAANLVQDQIKIKSKMLHETQDLQIIFKEKPLEQE